MPITQGISRDIPVAPPLNFGDYLAQFASSYTGQQEKQKESTSKELMTLLPALAAQGQIQQGGPLKFGGMNLGITAPAMDYTKLNAKNTYESNMGTLAPTLYDYMPKVYAAMNQSPEMMQEFLFNRDAGGKKIKKTIQEQNAFLAEVASGMLEEAKKRQAIINAGGVSAPDPGTSDPGTVVPKSGANNFASGGSNPFAGFSGLVQKNPYGFGWNLNQNITQDAGKWLTTPSQSPQAQVPRQAQFAPQAQTQQASTIPAGLTPEKFQARKDALALKKKTMQAQGVPDWKINATIAQGISDADGNPSDYGYK